MGLFDMITVECTLPLPGLDRAGTKWQTHDLDEAMESYIITADGILMKERFHIEDRADRSKPGLLGIFGTMTQVHDGWDETGYSGTINFYSDAADEDFEYDAEFVDGKITSVKRTDKDPSPAMAALLENVRLKKDLAQREEK
jgi:hypothetical protein